MSPRALVVSVCLAVVVAGFALGAFLARARGTDAPVPAAVRTPAPVLQATASPSPRVAIAPAPVAVVTRAPAPVAVATRAPAPVAVATRAPAPVAVVTAPPPDATAPPTVATAPPDRTRAGLAGWQVNEANVHVGTIVWAGTSDERNGALMLDLHKVSVAGHAVTPCERQTTLRATITVGAERQTVPYRETNCTGAVASGEVRVDRFARDGRSFGGSFLQDGATLGSFDARAR